jgi:hypothetical protein
LLPTVLVLRHIFQNGGYSLSYVYARDQHGSERSYQYYPNGYASSPTAFYVGSTPAPIVPSINCSTITVPTGHGFGGPYGGQYTAHPATFYEYGGFYGTTAGAGYGGLQVRGENYMVDTQRGLGAYGNEFSYGGGYGGYPYDNSSKGVTPKNLYPPVQVVDSATGVPLTNTASSPN